MLFLYVMLYVMSAKKTALELVRIELVQLTLRELAALADARGRFEWEQTASLMALIVNLMRDPKKNKPVKAEDFNPYTVKEKAFLKAPLSVLRDVFVKK